jgi:hypothetical protein
MRRFLTPRLSLELLLVLVILYLYTQAYQAPVGLIRFPQELQARATADLSASKVVFIAGPTDTCLVWHGARENSVLPIDCPGKGLGWVPNRDSTIHWTGTQKDPLHGITSKAQE